MRHIYRNIILLMTVLCLLEKDGRVLLQDIVIHKVPQNYGRVSWNGSVISIT